MPLQESVLSTLETNQLNPLVLSNTPAMCMCEKRLRLLPDQAMQLALYLRVKSVWGQGLEADSFALPLPA